MERIFGLVSPGLLADACFRFDHHVKPPSTTKRATARSSPFGFMAYLRFHQVPRPMPTTASGKNTTLIQNIMLARWLVTFRGWLEGSFGRIEIRSSSEESQLTMLEKRS